MPTKDNKTWKYNHGEKSVKAHNHGENSLKAPFKVYADLECLLIKVQSCQNNPKVSYT